MAYSSKGDRNWNHWWRLYGRKLGALFAVLGWVFCFSIILIGTYRDAYSDKCYSYCNKRNDIITIENPQYRDMLHGEGVFLGDTLTWYEQNWKFHKCWKDCRDGSEELITINTGDLFSTFLRLPWW